MGDTVVASLPPVFLLPDALILFKLESLQIRLHRKAARDHIENAVWTKIIDKQIKR